MTKAFYSFHFQNDASRAGQVRNMGMVEGDQLVDDNSWERVKLGGATGIQRWIDAQMSSCDVVIVLVGAQTSQRHWVNYEIRRAWDTYKPIFGVRIHGLKDLNQQTSSAGPNPFEGITLSGGGFLSQFVPLYNPSGYNSKDVYADIQSKLKGWVRAAPSRRR